MTEVKTNWGMCYTLEYPSVEPIRETQPAKNARTWHNIIWSFLESGREIVKVIPPESITANNASISLLKHLSSHDYPVGYFRRGEVIYLYRIF